MNLCKRACLYSIRKKGKTLMLLAFLQNLFAIPICAGIGMLIGIVIGTLIDYGKNHQEK